MTTSEQMFLILCQELSFSKAAEKCFISQQGLSDHIRRLEERYKIVLFQRRPRVSLTPAGEALRRTLLQEQLMEQDLARELSGLSSGDRGQVRLGLVVTRTDRYLPRILKKLWEKNPEVEVIVNTAGTAQLTEELERGDLDCVIGTDVKLHDGLTCYSMGDESIRLVIPCSLLTEELSSLGTSLTDLHPIASIPFIRNTPGSIINNKINAVLARQGITLRQRAAVSDYDVHLDFCRRGWGAAFLPDSQLADYGYDKLSDEGLIVFDVAALKHAFQIDLVWDSRRLYPACVERLLECVKEINW